jgi:hypothetical protein
MAAGGFISMRGKKHLKNYRRHALSMSCQPQRKSA